MIADVEKAFHQVRVDPADRHRLRILYPKSPTAKNCIDNYYTYRYTRVVFGLTCSPYLLYKTIRHHLSSKLCENYSTPIIETLKTDIYSDNVVTSISNVHDATMFFNETVDIFASAGMNIDLMKGLFDIRNHTNWMNTKSQQQR